MTHTRHAHAQLLYDSNARSNHHQLKAALALALPPPLRSHNFPLFLLHQHPNKMMKLTILASIVGSAAAFAPSASTGVSTALSSSPAPVNGWSVDESKPCYGLPGAPYSFMDPFNFTKGRSVNYVKRLREAEVMHCRVAMMATVGYFVGEATPTIGYGLDIHHTMANNQLAELPTNLLLPLFLGINFAEAFRASKGWVNPKEGSLFTLRDEYYPGDLGFDPFGLKPTTKDGFVDVDGFVKMQEGELNNGRLAMLAVGVMCAQEQFTGHSIF